MPAPLHTCPICRQPIPERHQQILDGVAAGETYEAIGKRVKCSARTVQRVAKDYGMERPVGRPWPKKPPTRGGGE